MLRVEPLNLGIATQPAIKAEGEQAKRAGTAAPAPAAPGPPPPAVALAPFAGPLATAAGALLAGSQLADPNGMVSVFHTLHAKRAALHRPPDHPPAQELTCNQLPSLSPHPTPSLPAGVRTRSL
jgi:hypothetical protein